MSEHTLPTRVPDMTLHAGKMAVWYQPNKTVAVVNIKGEHFIYAENIDAGKGFMSRACAAFLDLIIEKYGDRIHIEE